VSILVSVLLCGDSLSGLIIFVFSTSSSALAAAFKDMSKDDFANFLLNIYTISVCLVEGTKAIQDAFLKTLQEAQARGILMDHNLTFDDERTDINRSSPSKFMDDDEDELGSTDLLTPKLESEKKSSTAEANVDSPSIITPATTMNQIASDISNLVFSVAEVLTTKCTKVIAVRDTMSLQNPQDFFWFHGCTLSFSKILELYASRSIYNLKTILQSQVCGASCYI
jgi:hypothetical protein